MNVALVTGEPTASRLTSLAIDSLRALRWNQVRAAMLLGLALTAWNWVVFMRPNVFIAQSLPLGRMVLGDLIWDQLRALCLLAAIVIADRAVDLGAPRRRAYLLAALVGCIAGTLVGTSFQWAWRTYVLLQLPPAEYTWLHGTQVLFYWPIKSFTHWLLIGGAVVFLYADRRAARRTAQLLNAAELDRIRRSRLALESRLQAMQARVEPQFLFNTLGQVERLYELDAALGTRMLDDLIAYLRAAMPLMRDTSSTLAQEIALARAYLDIVRLRLGDRLTFAIETPPDAEGIRMPPMMLLPLIDHAIVHGLEASRVAGTISVRCEVRDGRLRLMLEDTGAGFVPETGGAGIASIRERLDALYGERAKLDLHRADSRGTVAVLEFPLEARNGG